MWPPVRGGVLRLECQASEEPTPPELNGVSHGLLKVDMVPTLVCQSPSREASRQATEREGLLSSRHGPPVFHLKLVPGLLQVSMFTSARG